MQVQRVTELEGLLHENQIDTPQIRKLQEKNDELWLQLQQWERVYHKEKILAASELKTQQDELLNELEYLLAVSEDEIIQRQEVIYCSKGNLLAKANTYGQQVDDRKTRLKTILMSRELRSLKQYVPRTIKQ